MCIIKFDKQRYRVAVPFVSQGKHSVPRDEDIVCLLAIVATVVVVFTISVRKRTGGVLPSAVQVLGIVN